jgi:hypothetical protein
MFSLYAPCGPKIGLINYLMLSVAILIFVFKSKNSALKVFAQNLCRGLFLPLPPDPMPMHCLVLDVDIDNIMVAGEVYPTKTCILPSFQFKETTTLIDIVNNRHGKIGLINYLMLSVRRSPCNIYEH